MIVSIVVRSREVIAFFIFVLIRRHSQSLFQIGARTERIVALAREDQSSCAAFTVFFMQSLDDAVQFAEQLLRDRVAGFGTVEREYRDGARVWSRDARDLESCAEGRGIAALVMLDSGSQPLPVGGDDAAAGEVAEHDCMVGASNRDRLQSLGQGELQVGESMQCLDLGRLRADG